MPGATTLVFVRHAEANHNLGGQQAVMAGWADLPLTRRGEHQAEQLAARLLVEPAPAALYVSPSARARDTALPVAARLALELVIQDDLREIGCGSVDGVTIVEVQRRHPQLWAAHLRQRDADFRWPGGESYREFRQRVLGAMGRIAAAHVGQRVLVVTHAGVISQVVGYCRGRSPACWEQSRPRNATLTTVRWQPDRVHVLSFDVASPRLDATGSS